MPPASRMFQVPQLGLRPIWHVKRSWIARHLFLAMLAYHAVQVIRARLKGATSTCRGTGSEPAAAVGRMELRETNGQP